MKILLITPGSGDSFYCENCLRDQDLMRALRAAGHDAQMVPLYLPPTTDNLPVALAAPIFFGGVNVYLQQKSALFRHTPRWLDRLLDAPWLLKLAGRLAGMTSAKDLAETTLSMLRGEDGRQKKELRRLMDYLASQGQPDVVCLSNALLAGMAKAIKEALHAPVACLLQDEDEFLDGLAPADQGRAWQVLSEKCRDINAFVGVSKYYADFMQPRLAIPPDRMHVVYAGVAADRYIPAGPASPPAIGFLSRMYARKGLDLLAEAFATLRQDTRFADLTLRIAGGKTSADDAYLRQVLAGLESQGLAQSVEVLPNLAFDQRVQFLQSLSVLCVPERVGEASGRYIMEALACGVPVVQPANGVSVELVKATGGGVLCHADAKSLAAALETVLADPARARQLGAAGRAAVMEKFTVQHAAAGLLDVFKTLTKSH